MYYSIATLWGVWQGATLATLLPVVHIVSGFQHQAILFGMVLFSQGLGSVLMTQVYGEYSHQIMTNNVAILVL